MQYYLWHPPTYPPFPPTERMRCLIGNLTFPVDFITDCWREIREKKGKEKKKARESPVLPPEEFVLFPETEMWRHFEFRFFMWYTDLRKVDVVVDDSL